MTDDSNNPRSTVSSYGILCRSHNRTSSGSNLEFTNKYISALDKIELMSLPAESQVVSIHTNSLLRH